MKTLITSELNVGILKSFIESHNIPDNAEIIWESRDQSDYVLTHMCQEGGVEALKMDKNRAFKPCLTEEKHFLIIHGLAMPDFF